MNRVYYPKLPDTIHGKPERSAIGSDTHISAAIKRPNFSESRGHSMKTSTEIGSIAQHIGEERAVEATAKAGFDAWDFSMFTMGSDGWAAPGMIAAGRHLVTARHLRRIGLDNGILCNQSHAPFPSPKMLDYLKPAIECTAEAGGKICIIHPDNDSTPEQNAEMYARLLPFAKGCGVKIATENMWNWDSETDEALFAACATPESFSAHLDAVGDADFVACLDIGHAEMRGVGTSAVAMIHTLGERLQALHIHDNDRRYDLHQIPFSQSIDFAPIVKALQEIHYAGYFTLEADAFLRQYTEDTLMTGLRRMSETARKLAAMFTDALE